MKKLLSAMIVLGFVIAAGLLVHWESLASELNEIFCPSCSLSEDAAPAISSLMPSAPVPTPFPETEGWVPGDTSVSGLSEEEKDRLLGVPADVAAWEEEQVKLQVEAFSSKTFVYPDEIDWRNITNQDWTTPIRDQGGCGSCVAFATVAAIESRLEIVKGAPDLNPDLAENQLFFCGCGECCNRGWWPDKALDFIRDTGIVDEDCDPYEDCDQACSPCSDWEDRLTTIHHWEGISYPEMVKWNIANYGPVVVTMTVYEDFFYYTGGIYRYTWGGFCGIHAVTLVGYNDVEGYWIAKNSWGMEWGEEGWFRIAYAEVTVDDYFYVPIVDAPDPGEVCENVSEIPQSECSALVELYTSSYGDGWNNNSGWLETKTPCNWYGVVCRENHVKELNLASNGLRNKLPYTITDLQKIEAIDFSENDFYGPIPIALADLGQLRILSLAQNHFSGRIPRELEELSNLEELHLDQNDLEGSIPSELGQLINLKVLRLNNNLLSSSLPTSFGYLTKLQELDLKNNDIVGGIPASFLNLTSLENGRLDLDYLGLRTSDPIVSAFIEEKDPGWEDTQTVPPSNIQITQVSNNEVELTWTPISYTENGGHYRIGYESQNDDIEEFLTEDKTSSSYLIDGLMPGIGYDFNVSTITLHHGEQRNSISSARAPLFIKLAPYNCDLVTTVPKEECQALIALFQDTNGLHWENNEGWLRTNDPCNWFGVGCQGGHVRGIILPDNRLWGALPAELSDLNDLTALQLQHNHLTGELPSQLGQIAGLQILDLSGNEIRGEIPATIGNLTHLTQLWLGDNRLSGGIPTSIGNLTQLVESSLSYNALIGEIPSSFMNLTKLDSGWLDISYNALSASDPDLRAFLIKKDPNWAMSQTIPPSDLQASDQSSTSVKLTWTPVHYTGDGGWYEVWVAEDGGNFVSHGKTLNKTVSEYLVENLDSGSDYRFKLRTFTPAHYPQQSDLWSVFSEEAGKEGEPFNCEKVTQIPLSECQALEAFYHSTNGPRWTNNLDWIRTLTPCSWYGIGCENGHVTTISLRMNNLQGVLPHEIGDLIELRGLHLSENRLSGSIPSEITQLAHLMGINLSDNEMSDSIPTGLSNLNDLTSLQMAGNRLTGPIPAEIGTLTSLTRIDLAGNKLSGEIPASLGNLTNLRELWLNHNRLTGEIPTSMGNLTLLLELTLNSNALVGEIPTTFLNLTELDAGWVAFDYNGLTASDSALFEYLSQKNPGWWKTQTVPPTDLIAVPALRNGVELFWTPIIYNQSGGWYEIWMASEGSGFTMHGKTENKLIPSYFIPDLQPGMEYSFKVRTYTPASGNAQKEIWSAFSEIIRFRIEPATPFPTETSPTPIPVPTKMTPTPASVPTEVVPTSTPLPTKMIPTPITSQED